MSATETFQFFNFTLRPAGAIATDAVLAKEWTEADPWHCSTVNPAFWLEQGIDCDSYLLFDEQGPVFFWKGVLTPRDDMAVQMHIQFPPMPADRIERHQLRERIRSGLILGLFWLEGLLRKTSAVEIYFDSVNPQMIEFATHHLKFTQDGPLLKKRLSPSPEAQTLLERAV